MNKKRTKTDIEDSEPAELFLETSQEKVQKEREITKKLAELNFNYNF